MAGLSLRNLVKKFGDTTVVHNFNLEIQDKEFLVLVGPSGCGKTTTLRMVAGLEDITEGELYIGDRLVNDIAAKDRDIAMVFQNYALYPHMNVYENMAFGLELRKLPKSEIQQRVQDAAKILSIEHLLERKPKALSGGQRQRVALGRAIVREPKVFLMDEPLSNLDAKLRVQMRAEISKLHQRLQTTILYVTHDQTEAMTMGDRIVVMKDGYIQQVDKPMNLYHHPKNLFVAGFIGSPAMNFLVLRVESIDGEIWLTKQGTRLQSDPCHRSALESRAGQEVIMGIRPEYIHEDPAFLAEFPFWAVEVMIDVVEPLGIETNVYFSLHEDNFIARFKGNSDVTVRQQQKVGFDLRFAHFFDAETQEVIR